MLHAPKLKNEVITDALIDQIYKRHKLESLEKRLTCFGRHRKWPFLGGKPPLFWFFKITGKVVENHPFWWIFQKTRKSGGFPPLFVIFTQNLFIFYQIKFFFGRETTIFSGFFKNPSKRVVFHQFHGFFQKPEKWWFSTIFYGFSKKPPKWVGFHHFWLVKTAHSVQIMLMIEQKVHFLTFFGLFSGFFQYLAEKSQKNSLFSIF